jgi:hypothetical protein
MQPAFPRTTAERRQNYDRQRPDIIDPYAIAVRRFHLKQIATFRQVCISRDTLIFDVRPVIFKSIQHICIHDTPGIRHIYRRILYRKNILLMRKR